MLGFPNDHTGHSDLMVDGFDYHFTHGQNYTDDEDAQRAIFRAYQSYPANMVEGRATLVCPGGRPGSWLSVIQPPQVIQNHAQILADMVGGGVDSGVISMQPLTDASF